VIKSDYPGFEPKKDSSFEESNCLAMWILEGCWENSTDFPIGVNVMLAVVLHDSSIKEPRER
jgi:hypothetical protein